MDTSKFLTEIRKIVREEIVIAMDSVMAHTDRRIVEVITKRLNENKIKRSQDNTTPSTPSVKSERDFIKKIKESIDTTNPSTSKSKQKKIIQDNPVKNTVPEFVKSLPSYLQEAVGQTSIDITNGTTQRLGRDVSSPGHDMYDWSTVGTYTTNDVAVSPSIPGVDDELPDFLSSAISRAGEVVKRSNEISKLR